MKRKLALILALLMVITMSVACGTREAAPEAPAEEVDAPEASADGVEGKTFAFIFKNTGNPYGDAQIDGFIEAIESRGGTAIARAPDLPTAEGQIQIIEELIAQGVDSITIVGNDVDALEPVLTRAMDAGIKVSAADSSVNPNSRQVFVNQTSTDLFAQSMIEGALELMDGEGQFAILSATAQATNQNAWIASMIEQMENDSRFDNMELVEIVYGDDLRDKSIAETEALLLKWPDLRCIVIPTTVGLAAAAVVITEQGLQGEVLLTGGGLPSEMYEFIMNGACPFMFLWNPIDVGYLAGHAAMALVEGTITGAEGDTFTAGRLGEYTVVAAADGGTEIILGPPYRFDASNIALWKDVY